MNASDLIGTSKIMQELCDENRYPLICIQSELLRKDMDISVGGLSLAKEDYDPRNQQGSTETPLGGLIRQWRDGLSVPSLLRQQVEPER